MKGRKTRRPLFLLLVLLAAAAGWAALKDGPPAAPQLGAAAVPTSRPAVSAAPVLTAMLEQATAIDEDGVYTSREDISLYLYTFGRLPGNFITKTEARALGWPGGDLRPYAADACIGGDRFGNYEGLLPEKKGRVYYECDIDTLNRDNRGARRIVFSSDGLIYYTDDHYESFTLLYGEDGHAGG